MFNQAQSSLPQVGKLSQSLDELETKVEKIGMNSSVESINLLVLMDTLKTKLSEYKENYQPQEHQEEKFNELTQKFRKKGKVFLRDIGGKHTLIHQRQEVNPPQDFWWWYIDEILAKQFSKQVRKTLIRLLIFIIIFAAGVLIYNKFFAPDESTKARYSHEFSGQSFAMQGNYEEALSEYQTALEYEPDQPDLLVMIGILQEKTGKTEEAEATLNDAKDLVKNEETFLTLLGEAYIQVNDVDNTIKTAHELIDLNDQSLYGYFYLGTAYESQGKTGEAIQAYEKAAEYADQNEKFEMVAIIKMRLSVLMQSVGQPGQ